MFIPLRGLHKTMSISGDFPASVVRLPQPVNAMPCWIELHAEMSMLASLLTTLTHLRADDYKHMKHMTIKLS